MVRSIDVGYGAGTHMAARFVLDKVVCETISPPVGFGASRLALCTRVNVQRRYYQDIAAVREDAAKRMVFYTSQDLLAVLKTEGSGEHWHHCN